ncbi:MAG TPA: hypothetical protein VFH61_00055 [Thermoleophilia bacterium]|nr:hypothetical protein [Thermoleophilia bacterium]
MDFAIVILIALAAAVAYIVLRVGLDSREAAPIHGSVQQALPTDPDSGASLGSVRGPEEHTQIHHRGTADHSQDGQR